MATEEDTTSTTDSPGINVAYLAKLTELERRLDTIEAHQIMRLPVITMEPHSYRLRKPFEIVVRPVEESYVATLFDANISMSGDNPVEAFENLKGMIVDTFEMLKDHKPEELGKEPTRQLSVLNDLLERA